MIRISVLALSLIAASSAVAAPVMAGLERPLDRGASIYDAAPGTKLMAEPSERSRAVAAIRPGYAVAVREVLPPCKMPKGWVWAQNADHSGYLRKPDLRPRLHFGMPE